MPIVLPRHAASRTLLAVALLLTALTGVLVAGEGDAHALCAVQEEDGSWRNVDPATGGITRIDLRFVCQDQVLNGQPYPPGPPWYVHAHGACHPTDCDWGEVGATRTSGGHVYGVYQQGFATRHVWAKMSAYRPGQLWVHTFVDFADPGRADYRSDAWFTRS